MLLVGHHLRGTPGYTYCWAGGNYRNPAGADCFGRTPSSGSFYVKVTVTDAVNATRLAYILVSVDRFVPECMI